MTRGSEREERLHCADDPNETTCCDTQRVLENCELNVEILLDRTWCVDDCRSQHSWRVFLEAKTALVGLQRPVQLFLYQCTSVDERAFAICEL